MPDKKIAKMLIGDYLKLRKTFYIIELWAVKMW
jgi:hypothetical protein